MFFLASFVRAMFGWWCWHSLTTTTAFVVVHPATTNTGYYQHPFDSSRLYSSSSSSTTTRKQQRQTTRPPSRVSDPAGPTPEDPPYEPDVVNPDTDIPELQDIRQAADLPHPIPHQPWRRGDTAGCEAPIAAPWRRQAHDIINRAVTLVGGRVLDVTWFLTAVLITLDDEHKPERDFTKASGPVITILDPAAPMYYDPADPNPEPIWSDEEGILYERETAEEQVATQQRRQRMYAPQDVNDDPEEPHIQDPDHSGENVDLYMNEETRQQVAVTVMEELQQRELEAEHAMDLDHAIRIDTAALSTMAEAILEALQEVEDELKILARHEVVLTSPGPPDVIETQRQFDAYRGYSVMVETQDPFESNRTLRGKLVDRNAMDVMINKKGRLVTIPLNFVKCVRLLPAGAVVDLEDEEEDDDEEEE